MKEDCLWLLRVCSPESINSQKKVVCGCWKLTIQFPTVMSFLRVLEWGQLRHNMFTVCGGFWLINFWTIFMHLPLFAFLFRDLSNRIGFIT